MSALAMLLALVAGLAAAVVLERGLATTFAKPVLARENYRGHTLPTASGFVLIAAVFAVDGLATLVRIVGVDSDLLRPMAPVMVMAVAAFGLLGLADDLLGDGGDRGLKGHIRAALSGRITTGFVKLGGGASVALMLASWLGSDTWWRTLVDGAVIALAANMGNLFDRAPGRTAKIGLLCAAPLLVSVALADTNADLSAGVALAVVAGATLGLLRSDLAERSMLGDTGANALGAALGVAAVLSTSETTRLVIAVVLFVLTLASEKISFTRVIDSVAPLRWFDRLGGLRSGSAG